MISFKSTIGPGLERARKEFLKAAKESEKETGDEVLERSDPPVLTGALEGTGRVRQENGETIISFGGGSVDYAAKVHYDPNSSNPLFLQKALDKYGGRMLDRTADSWRKL